MKLILSEIYSNFVALYYNGYPKLKYINKKGYWEFEILDFDNLSTVIYKTKGLR